MTISIVYLVKGMLDEKSRCTFISEMKKLVTEGLRLDKSSAGVIIHELESDNMCDTAQKMVTLYIYTAKGISIDDKAGIIRAARDVFDNYFGDRGEGKNVVIIKEHSCENFGLEGVSKAAAHKANKIRNK